MAPREKTTAEQKVHLLARLDDYIESRKHNALTKFWASLFQSWFALWPETEDMSIENAERRKAAHGQAIDQKQEVSVRVRGWFVDPDISLFSISRLGTETAPDQRGPGHVLPLAKWWWHQRLNRHVAFSRLRFTSKNTMQLVWRPSSTPKG